jgi:hypothetical protein
MPYELTWLVEGRVVLGKFIGQLAEDSIPEYDKTMLEYLNIGTGALVHQLADARELESMPGMAALNKLTYGRHPRMGWQLSFGLRKPLIKMAINIMSQVFKMRSRNFDTQEEALDFLQSVDATLPDLRTALTEHTANTN